MAKKEKEVAPKKQKKPSATKVDVLKVSKKVKIMAAFSTLRGHKMRSVIRLLGEAEDNYKKFGRLVMA